MDSVQLRQHLDDLSNPEMPLPTAEQLQAANTALCQMWDSLPEGRRDALDDRLNAAYLRLQLSQYAPGEPLGEEEEDWIDGVLSTL